MGMQTVCIQLEQETVRELDGLADQLRRSRSGIIRAVVENWLLASACDASADEILSSAEAEG